MNTIPNTPREVYNAAHPFFIIDVDQSRIDRQSLSQTLASLRDTYFVEHIGIAIEDGRPVMIDRMYVWYYNPAFRYPDETYRPDALVCFLQKLGFAIDERDVCLQHTTDCYGGISCELAPIVAFPENFLLTCMSGKMTSPECYIELMSHYRSNIQAMTGCDHHIRDGHNQPARKEDN